MTTGDLAVAPPATEPAAEGLTLPRPAHRCAPLREGPAWERALRYALALLAVAGVAYGITASLRAPVAREPRSEPGLAP